MPKPTPGAAPAETTARRKLLRKVALRLGHKFRDLELLDRALCHSSTGNEGKQNYERLEFLGDAVLGFLIAELLFRDRPDIPEGQLTDRRARLVSREPLAAVADHLDLIANLTVGRGIREQDRASPRIRADLVEAVLGAIYLDGGIRAARKFVRAQIWQRLAGEAEAAPPQRDPKSRLLHLAQTRDLGQPAYEILETSGPPHERSFVVAVLLRGEPVAEGTGRSKQAAEKQAAAAALARLCVPPGENQLAPPGEPG